MIRSSRQLGPPPSPYKLMLASTTMIYAAIICFVVAVHLTRHAFLLQTVCLGFAVSAGLVALIGCIWCNESTKATRAFARTMLILLLGAASCLAYEQEPYLAIEKQAYTITSTRTVTWRMDSTDADAQPAAAVIAGVMADPHGWTQAGVTFVQTQDSSADITIRLAEQPVLTDHCKPEKGVISLACTVPTSFGICTIMIGHQNLPYENRSYFVNYQAVNHELGHCFGLAHRPDDLMEALESGGHPYPSAQEIVELRSHFG